MLDNRGVKRFYLKKDGEYKEEISNLYLSAFPEDERPPLFWFFECLYKHDANEVISYGVDGQFIGFTMLAHYEDIYYICYLAVKEEYRNQGYGSRMIMDIKYTHQDSTILVCFEEDDPKYIDYELRRRRHLFYIRHGFIDNGLKTREGEVVYQSSYYGSHKVNYETYCKIFDICYGEGAHLKYLKCEKEY